MPSATACMLAATQKTLAKFLEAAASVFAVLVLCAGQLAV